MKWRSDLRLWTHDLYAAAWLSQCPNGGAFDLIRLRELIATINNTHQLKGVPPLIAVRRRKQSVSLNIDAGSFDRAAARFFPRVMRLLVIDLTTAVQL